MKNISLITALSDRCMKEGYVVEQSLLQADDEEIYNLLSDKGLVGLLNQGYISKITDSNFRAHNEVDKREWSGSNISIEEGDYEFPHDIQPLLNALAAGNIDEAVRLGYCKSKYVVNGNEPNKPELVSSNLTVPWYLAPWKYIKSLGKMILVILGLDQFVIPWLDRVIGEHNGFKTKLLFPLLVKLGYDNLSYDSNDHRDDDEQNDNTVLSEYLQMFYSHYYPCINTATPIFDFPYVYEGEEYEKEVLVTSGSKSLVVRKLNQAAKEMGAKRQISNITKALDKYIKDADGICKSYSILGDIVEVINPLIRPTSCDITIITEALDGPSEDKLKYSKIANFSILGYSRVDLALVRLIDIKGMPLICYAIFDADAWFIDNGLMFSDYFALA